MRGGRKMCMSEKDNDGRPRGKELAVGYMRVAQRKQEYGLSLPVQEKLLRDYAEGNNLEIVGIFKDVASGSDIARSGLRNMTSYLREHPESRNLLVVGMERLSGNITDLVRLREIDDLVIHEARK